MVPLSTGILGSYQSQASSTSVSSSIECAIADSRLSSLIAPTSDTLPPRSALAKKRSVKPCFRDTPCSKKPRVTFKLDNEKKTKNNRPTRPPVKTKAEVCIAHRNSFCASYYSDVSWRMILINLFSNLLPSAEIYGR